jgi:hypothetical protein
LRVTTLERLASKSQAPNFEHGTVAAPDEPSGN